MHNEPEALLALLWFKIACAFGVGDLLVSSMCFVESRFVSCTFFFGFCRRDETLLLRYSTKLKMEIRGRVLHKVILVFVFLRECSCGIAKPTMANLDGLKRACGGPLGVMHMFEESAMEDIDSMLSEFGMSYAGEAKQVSARVLPVFSWSFSPSHKRTSVLVTSIRLRLMFRNLKLNP